MASTFDIFGVSLDLDVKGNDQVEKALTKIIQQGKTAGASFDQITRALRSFINEIGAVQRAGGIRWNQQSGWENKSENWLKKALGLDKQPDKDKNPFGRVQSPQYVMAKIFRDSNIGKTYTAFQSLNLAFAQVKSIWKYGEAISSVNQKLLLLSYSSGIGVSSLKDMGAAAEAFGGSAQTIASAEERLQKQLAAAKRGQGFGFLQDVFWKYGFQVDLGWNAEQMRESAIMHGRTMSAEDQLAFAEEVDPANKQLLLTLMRASPEMVERWRQSQRFINEQGDSETIGGKNRAREAADAALEFKMSMAELKRAWDAIRDQVSVTILPMMSGLVKALSSVLSVLNKWPGLISAITVGLTGLALVMAGAQLKGLYGWFLKNVSWARLLHLGGPKAYGFKDFMRENPALRGPSMWSRIGAALKTGMQWIGRFLARTLLFGFRMLAGLGRLIMAHPIAAIITAAIGVYSAVKKTCDDVKRESEKLNEKAEKVTTSGEVSRQIANETRAKRYLKGEIWEGDTDAMLGIGTRHENLSYLKDFETYKARYQWMQNFMADKYGFARTRIANWDAQMEAALRADYEQKVKEYGGSGTNINNSRVQLNQTNNIYGTNEPQAIKEAVVESGQTLAAKGTNLISNGGK